MIETLDEAVVEAASADPEHAVSEARKELVKGLMKNVAAARKHHGKAFKQMRENMQIAHRGTSKSGLSTNNYYIANITQRVVSQRVGTLYAKNPKAVAWNRDRREFKIWDGSMQSLQQAIQQLTMAQQGEGPPEAIAPAMALIQDYQQGMQRKQLYTAIGDTLVKLFHYYMDEQVPTFKTQMKQAVRRTITNSVSYVKLGYKREMERSPEASSGIQDAQIQLDHLESLIAAMGDEEKGLDETSAEAEELRLMLDKLQNQPMITLRQGLVFDFPSATSILVDPQCQNLSGFVGANWIVHEIFMTVEDVEEIFGVKLGTEEFTSYSKGGNRQGNTGGAAWNDKKARDGNYVCVLEFYDKKSGLVYTMADGYKDFLKEPTEPNVKVERFFPFYALVFNNIEHENVIFPQSDVELIKPMQDDYNLARQGLREHRKAARPRYVSTQGAMEDDDKTNLETAKAHSVTEIRGLQPGQKVTDLIQLLTSSGVDPNLYETAHISDDVNLTVGQQDANLGGTSGATATESGIAESSRLSSADSSVDDLDDFLTDVARDAGQILLMEMDPEEVAEIVGPGAVWPETSYEEVAKEIFLKVEAGSSGRPNKAADIANLERVMPFLIQLPGIDPHWLAREVLKRLDDRLDLTQAFTTGLQQLPPSIVAMNSQTQPGTGDPENSPEQQGVQGGDNAPRPGQINEPAQAPAQTGPSVPFG